MGVLRWLRCLLSSVTVAPTRRFPRLGQTPSVVAASLAASLGENGAITAALSVGDQDFFCFTGTD